MNAPMPELDSLKAAWQREAVALSAEAVRELRRGAERRTRQLLATHVFETAGTLACIALFVWLAQDAVTATGRAIYSALAIGGVLAQSWVLWMWRGLWRAPSQTPRALLELEVRRATMALRLAWIAVIGAPAGMAIGLLVATYAPTRTAIAIGTAGRVAIFALALVAYPIYVIRRERRRLASARRALEELDR